MLDLRQFAVLRAIDEAGSLAGAARRLHYGQPTVTHHLRGLESHLKVKLVRRSPRGAALTPPGEVFLEYANSILGLLDEAAAAVKESDNRQTLTVGTFQTAGALLLAPAISKARREGTLRSEVTLVHGSLAEHLDFLRAGTSDCAIVYSFRELVGSLIDGLDAEFLALDPYRLLVHESHSVAGSAAPIDLAALGNDGWIARNRPDEADDEALLAAATRTGFTPKIAFRNDDYTIATAFLASGGAMIAPKLYRQSDTAVVEVPTQQDLLGRRIYFVCRSGECAGEIQRIRDEVSTELTTRLALR